MLFLMALLKKLAMNLSKDTFVVIPCAGKGTRSKLPYPKSLYKIGNTTILNRIIKSFNKYNFNFKIVINKKNMQLFKSETKKISSKIEYLYQNIALGMGDAVLKITKSKDYRKMENIILIWGDVPFIKKSTINELIKNHFKNNNDFTFISGITKYPYTYVQRDKKNKVFRIKEMKNFKKKIKYGERNIGIFLFKKNYTIKILKKMKIKHKNNKEISFLNVIEYLNKENLKIEAINIATPREMKSLNYLKDLN